MRDTIKKLIELTVWKELKTISVDTDQNYGLKVQGDENEIKEICDDLGGIKKNNICSIDRGYA